MICLKGVHFRLIYDKHFLKIGFVFRMGILSDFIEQTYHEIEKKIILLC